MKIAAVLMYALIFTVGVVLIPPPPAQACYSYCGIDNCYNTSEYGYYRARNTSPPTYFVLLEKPMCTGSRFEQLYADCGEYPCIGKGNENVFHLENGIVSVFTVRNKREGDELLEALSHHSKVPKAEFTVPVGEFNQFHTKLLHDELKVSQ